MREVLDNLLKRITAHFDAEMVILDDINKANLTPEELRCLFETMAKHPHVANIPSLARMKEVQDKLAEFRGGE